MICIARYFIGIHLTYCYFFLLHIPPSSSRQAVWNVARSSVPLCRAETQWLNLCSAVPNAPVGKTLLTNTLFHWAMLSWCDPHPPPSIIIPPTPQSHPLQVISPGSLQAWGLRPKPAGTTGQFTSPGRPSTSTTSSPPSKATSVWCARAPWVTLHLTFFILFYFIQFFLDCIIKENCTYIWIVILRGGDSDERNLGFLCRRMLSHQVYNFHVKGNYMLNRQWGN